MHRSVFLRAEKVEHPRAEASNRGKARGGAPARAKCLSPTSALVSPAPGSPADRAAGPQGSSVSWGWHRRGPAPPHFRVDVGHGQEAVSQGQATCRVTLDRPLFPSGLRFRRRLQAKRCPGGKRGSGSGLRVAVGRSPGWSWRQTGCLACVPAPSAHPPVPHLPERPPSACAGHQGALSSGPLLFPHRLSQRPGRASALRVPRPVFTQGLWQETCLQFPSINGKRRRLPRPGLGSASSLDG